MVRRSLFINVNKPHTTVANVLATQIIFISNVYVLWYSVGVDCSATLWAEIEMYWYTQH